MKDVLTLILGGGRGTRLFPLTHMRSKPAVPIGGKYRLIDIPISNCLHAGLKRMFVLTQFNSASLNRTPALPICRSSDFLPGNGNDCATPMVCLALGKPRPLFTFHSSAVSSNSGLVQSLAW